MREFAFTGPRDWEWKSYPPLLSALWFLPPLQLSSRFSIKLLIEKRTKKKDIKVQKQQKKEKEIKKLNTFKPSKTLNIKSNFFGLTLDDLLGLMVFYTVFQLIFSFLGLEIVSLDFNFSHSSFPYSGET